MSDDDRFNWPGYRGFDYKTEPITEEQLTRWAAEGKLIVNSETVRDEFDIFLQWLLQTMTRTERMHILHRARKHFKNMPVELTGSALDAALEYFLKASDVFDRLEYKDRPKWMR